MPKGYTIMPQKYTTPWPERQIRFALARPFVLGSANGRPGRALSTPLSAPYFIPADWGGSPRVRGEKGEVGAIHESPLQTSDMGKGREDRRG
jgi:hypothetical protein